jgi:phage terminase large subunit-like protein
MARPETPVAQLERRGSRHAKSRKKQDREKGQPLEKKSKLHFNPFRLTKKKIEKICKGGVNGYDPWATADPGQWFDADAAREIVKFFHTDLVHVKGKKANHGFELEQWEIAALGNLFGWKNADGSRRYRVCLWFVPRKNGKTPLAAGIILYGLLKDDEPGAEIYGTASTYSQAALVFAQARGMVERNEWMSEACQIFKGQAKSIELRSDHSIYAVKASEGLAAHGWNTHMGLIDELHAQRDGELKEALETSVASEDRIQPLLMYLTTSDYDQPSVCNDEVDYAQQVKDGIVPDSAYLPVMYGADRKDDWKDEAVWERANPNIDVSVSRAYLRRKCEKAARSPADLNSFLRLHLNIRTSTDVLWLDTEIWDQGYRTDIDLTGRRCTAGLDISSTRDITAYVTLFALDDGYYYVLPKFWAPEEKIKSRDPKLSDRVDYQKWHAQGWITSTPGNTVDYSRMRADIVGRPAVPGRGDVPEAYEYGLRQTGIRVRPGIP